MTAREYIISKHPELADINRVRIMDIDDLEEIMEEWLAIMVGKGEISFTRKDRNIRGIPIMFTENSEGDLVIKK